MPKEKREKRKIGKIVVDRVPKIGSLSRQSGRCRKGQTDLRALIKARIAWGLHMLKEMPNSTDAMAGAKKEQSN